MMRSEKLVAIERMVWDVVHSYAFAEGVIVRNVRASSEMKY